MGGSGLCPGTTDSTWGSTWNGGQDLVYNGIFLAASHPDLKIEYDNTLREVRALLFQPDQINPLIDAFAAQIRDFIAADLIRWSNAPASSGNYVSLTSAAGFASPALTGGLGGLVQDLKTFLFTGGTYAWWIDRQTVSAGGWVTRLDSVCADTAIPSRPTLTYTGPTNFPVTGLRFTCSAFADPQGANTFGAVQWRLAEINPTNTAITQPSQLRFEWDAAWDSGELKGPTNTIQVPAVAAVPGHLYRARVRHKDNTGRWSQWSAPVQFTPASVDLVSGLQRDLVVSEIMYAPPSWNGTNGEEFEYLELHNAGTNPLDLSGLTFTAGITFTFTNGTSLSPDQYFLLGRNAAALQAKYPGIVVRGLYMGKLDNAGETVTLTHPYGIDVFSLSYGVSAPWPVTAAGFGFSLVQDEKDPGHYRASSQVGGSPGSVDPPTTLPRILVSELCARPFSGQDAVELCNPGPSAVDIGGWFLSDDPAYPWKYRIPDNTLLPAGGYQVFDGTQFNPTPGLGTSFGLSALGESL